MSDTRIDTRRSLELPGIGDVALALTPTRRGLFLCNRHDVIGFSLIEYGEWAEPEIALVSALLKPGDNVIECGANIGTITVPMARAVGPRGAVHAFELQPYLVRLLNANLALNGIGNAMPRNVAIGAAEGLMRVPTIPYDRPLNFSGISFAALPTDGSGTGAPIAARTLDGMFGDLKRLRLLKMDIENMEPAALAGATSLIERLQPIVYCEAREKNVFDAIRDFLGSRGYRLFWHAFPGFNPGNYRGSHFNRFGVQGDVNLLALPPGTEDGSPGLPPARDFAEIEQLWPGILGPAPGAAAGPVS